jgi:hypothetical protein
VVWGYDPIQGAVVVSALPVGTALAHRLREIPGVPAMVGGGAGLAGGLAGLALLPGLDAGWAAAALGLCGFGFGLLSDSLGALAVPTGSDGRAATLSSAGRHLGLVLGLILIAPVLAGAVDDATDDATLAATARVLDSEIGAREKVQIALDLRDALADQPDGEVPDVDPVFEANGAGEQEGVAALGRALETDVREELTRAFRSSFAIAAGLGAVAGLIGLLAVALAGGAASSIAAAGMAPVAVALVTVFAAMVLPISALRAGGDDIGTFEPVSSCDAPSNPFAPSGLDAAAQRFVLSGLYGAACELGVTREELVLSLGPRSSADIEWDNPTIEKAMRAGVSSAIDAADERDSIPGWLAWSLQRTVERAPLRWFFDRLGINTG